MEHTPSKAQGWYGDPFGRHNARWFSDGNPTALVRDDGVESTDPPPNTWYTSQLAPAPETEGELLHTHADAHRTHGGSIVNGIWGIFVSTGGD
jgi:hypothetical protein